MTSIARRDDPIRIRRHRPTRREACAGDAFAFPVAPLVVPGGRVRTCILKLRARANA